ncbi:hypothetical protein BRADI_2g49792v3 [Brachypodium distachyon]|uniref:Uncharacterized protein n=1 Tax=Brachypodium distachyon TaxID=15368 RepID=A0A0Q3GF51_BRADI|nr:hypothetical protein BRADI_2g49792v3 [Brachypodium distachyon]
MEEAEADEAAVIDRVPEGSMGSFKKESNPTSHPPRSTVYTTLFPLGLLVDFMSASCLLLLLGKKNLEEIEKKPADKKEEV